MLAVCAHFVQRKVILAYCGHTAAHGSNMPQVFRWCLDAVYRDYQQRAKLAASSSRSADAAGAAPDIFNCA